MSGVQANLLLAGVQNASPWLSTDELQAPAKLAMAQQRNALLNRMDEQTLQNNQIEYAARASAGLLSLNDEAAMAKAYPDVVAEGRKYGYLMNAPAEFPGVDRLKQIAAMGVSAKDQFEQQGVSGDYQTWLRSRGFGGGGMTAAPTTAGGTTASPGPIEADAQARAFAVRDGLIRRGMDPETATAFAANALHESSANPNVGRGDRGSSAGLFQWRDDRERAYIAKYGHSPQNAPLDEQLDFVMHELGGSESVARDRINSAKGVGDKAAQVSEAYLRPRDTVGEMQRRSATALQLAGALSNVTPGMTDQQWLDQMAKQYPSLAGPNANQNQPNLGTTPQPYQTASLTPTAPPGATPAAPAQPAATTTAQATPSAQPPPAATTAAAVAAVPAPPPRMANGLTADQNGTLQQLMAIRPRNRAEFDALQQKVVTTEQTFRDKNATEDRQYRLDVRQATLDAQKAQQEADKEARAAANDAALQKSKSDEADAERVLLAFGPKIQAGTATDDERRQYALMWDRYRSGPIQQIPDGKGGTMMARVPREIGPEFPTPPGRTTGPQTIPGTERPPERAPQVAEGGMLGNAEGQRKALAALTSLNAYPAGVGGSNVILGDIFKQRTDPAGVQVRADIGDVAGHIFHDLSGAAVSPTEAARLERFIPQPQDTAEAAKVKLQRLIDQNRQTMLAAYRTYGPENRGQRLLAVEEAILDSIPQPSIDSLRADPKRADDFDRKYGRGASKLVLQ